MEAALLEHPELTTQAEAIDNGRRDGALPPISACEDRTALPLSFAQARLWFLNQLEGDSQATSYNISAALQVAGRLDEAALRTALTALTERHES